MSGDPFGELMGERRGSGRCGEPASTQPWWRLPAPHHQRLAEWLAHVAASGYVELVLVFRDMPNQSILRAFREDRSSGYAVLDIDGAEEMWLEEHWPRELITEREEDRKRGRLFAV